MQVATQDRIQVREYRPEGGVSVIGVLLMAPSLFLAGIVLGVVGHFISLLFWIVIIFPALLGGGMGLVARAMVRVGKVRSPVVAGVLGFIGGFAAMFMMHYCGYRHFRSDIDQLPAEIRRLAGMSETERMRALAKGMSIDEAAKAVDLVKMVSIDSMLDYMNWRAHKGVRVGHAGSDSGINLGFMGSWIYWGIEVLIVAAITYALAKHAAGRPFCARCDQWKVYRPLGCFTGPFLQVHEAVRQGNVARLRELGPVLRAADVMLWAGECPQCHAWAEVELKLDVVTVNGKGQRVSSTLIECTTPGSSLAVLRPIFASTAVPQVSLPAKGSRGSEP